LDLAFASLSQSAQSNSPAKPSFLILSEDILFNTIEFLSKLFKSFVAHEIDLLVVSQAVRNSRNRVTATSALFHQLKSNVITSDLRANCVELIRWLCFTDEQGCALAAINELQKCYESATLNSLEEVRKATERSRGEAARKSIAGTEKTEDDAKAMHESRSVELWPSCRGDPDDVSPEAEVAYWDVALQLCRQAVESTGSQDEMSEVVATLKLLMSCSIDVLDGQDKPEVLTGFSELINVWIESANEEVAADPGDAAMASEPTGELEGNKLKEALLNEEYVKAWVFRLLTCYKDYLDCDVVSTICQRLLDISQSQWTPDEERLVCSLISDDFTKSLRRMSEESSGKASRKSGSTRAGPELLQELLQNLRPLSLLAEASPQLFSVAVDLVPDFNVEFLKECVNKSKDKDKEGKMEKVLGSIVKALKHKK